MRFSQLVPAWKHESVGRVLSEHQLGKPYQIADHNCRITWVYNKIHRTPLGFPSWCPESTRPMDSCFQGTSWDNLMMYCGLYQHTLVVLYILLYVIFRILPAKVQNMIPSTNYLLGIPTCVQHPQLHKWNYKVFSNHKNYKYVYSL